MSQDPPISILEVARKAGLAFKRSSQHEYAVRCPKSDRHRRGDLTPSCRLNNEKETFYCDVCGVGGGVKKFMKLLGLDLPRMTRPPRPVGQVLTVARLAQDKNLPAEFLKTLGMKDRSDGVLIPYRQLDGSPAPRQRLRTALCAKEGSLWLPGGGKPTPYGLERIKQAKEHGFLVLVEGESDTWTLWHHALPALGIPGAGMYRKLDSAHLEELERLYIVHEPDDGGDSFLRGVTKRLFELGWKGQAFQIRLSDADDVNDLHKQNPSRFRKAFRKALRSAEPLTLQADPEDPATGSKGKKSQSTLLLELAESVELFHDPNENGYATFQVANHQETRSLKGRDFRQFLTREFYRVHGKSPNSRAFQEAMGVLEAKACFDGNKEQVFIRVGEHDGKIYLDLANEAWEAVEIDEQGWRIITLPPVRFRRTRGMNSLPRPVPGGNVDELRRFVNLENDDDWRLFLGWILGALRPRGPYPVLILNGEHGSAKSTAARVARSLVDPNTAPLRAEPREVRDLMIGASNAWCLAFDNVSRLHPWLSDALCRLATGGGFSTRELYTDGEEVIFEAQRPVVVNGIEDIATRSDLLDRSLVLCLPSITEEKRRSEADFWGEFERERPHFFGALLDIISIALKQLPEVKLPRSPRMADFALWVTASAKALNWPDGSFLQAYSRNREMSDALVLESTAIAPAILALSDFEGTSSDLLARLNEEAEERARKLPSWPKSARALSGALRRMAPNLRSAGCEVTFARGSTAQRRRLITIRNSRETTVQTVQTVQPPEKQAPISDGLDGKAPALDGLPFPVDEEVDGMGPL